MKRIVLTASLFLGCMSLSNAWAAVDLTLFEQDFLRGKGKPDSFAESFVAQEQQARVIISNGGENGSKKVSSASVVLNGKKIVGPRDFNQKVSVQEFTVDLLGENTLAVELSSKPGSSLHVQVIQEIDADAAAVVGPEGGMVAVEDAGSPIYGAKIEVPAGALDEDIVLTMKEKDPAESALPEKLMHVGPIVDFGPDGTQFLSGVTVTLPYYDNDNDGYLDGTGVHENNVFPGFHDHNSSEWEYPEKLTQNTSDNTDTFEIKHFSDATQFTGKKTKLGVVYEILGDKIYTAKREYRTDEERTGEEKYLIDRNNYGEYLYNNVNEDLDKMKLWIASCDNYDCTSRRNTDASLNLVVHSTVPWKLSYPDLTPDELLQSTLLFPSEKIDSQYYQYLVDYVSLLKEQNIKWTPVLNINDTPSWLENLYIDDVIKINGGKNNLSSFLFKPKSKIWDYTEGWIKGFIFALRDYIGEGNTIEEIFICNEMQLAEDDNSKISGKRFSFDSLSDKESAMAEFFNTMRNYVISSLGSKKDKVKVGWKFNPYAFENGNQDETGLISYTGISKGMLEKLLMMNDSSSDYPRPNLLGFDIYEGKKDITISFEDTDTYKGVKGYLKGDNQLDFMNKDKFPGLVGGIYFPEYNSDARGEKPGTKEKVGLLTANELENLIVKSKDLDVRYWAYFKWNGDKREWDQHGDITEDQIIGLCNTFDKLGGNPKYVEFFPDVKICDPYKDAIKEMKKLGVIHGHDDGEFKPGDFVNRAEFAKMLVRTAEELGIDFDKDKQDSGFSDVPAGEWFKDSIDKLYSKKIYINGILSKKGIIQGYDDNTFRPQNYINFAEMIKMIVQTFSPEIPSCKEFEQPKNPTVIFCNTTTEWYDSYFIKAKELGIKPVIRGSEWKSVDTENPYGIYNYVISMNVQRRKVVKALFDAYNYCKTYPYNCPMIGSGE